MRWMVIFLLCILTSFRQEIPLDGFLKKPFDLQKFKKTKGPSNSGGADVQPYYFKPDYTGVYYRFFLFRGYRGFVYARKNGEMVKHPVRSITGLQLITYKPLGKYRDEYFDPTEILIEVNANHNDYDLPELAFIGLDSMTIKQKLGASFIRKDSCFVYHNKTHALVLSIPNGFVKCLKYARLKKGIINHQLPMELTRMDCSGKL